MKLPSGAFPDKEEQELFISTYRQLAEGTASMFTRKQWKEIRNTVRRGILAGAYGRDQHGVDTLLHSLGTCLALTNEVGLKQPSLLTVMLAPIIESGILDIAEVRSLYGEDTAHLLECLGRVKKLYSEHDSLQDENFRKLLLSFAEDIRVIICLIADRYVLLRMLNHSTDTEYRSHVVQECNLLYTPMAHRLGLYAIKSALEDMAVKYEHRDVYDDIAHQLSDTKRARDAYMEAFMEPLRKRLDETHMKYVMKGRTKSISSIWNKLKNQNTTVDKIYDLFAIRIIIDAPLEKEKALCWHAYSIVTDMYQPNPKRLKDWLSIPKSNGYESLHITVYGPENRWVEVQIRTRRMDEIAERGIAAHWAYKGIKSEGAADRIMAGIREVLETNSSPDELMKDLSMGLYKEEIFVFTPNGDVHKLPKGATVLDFAFGIHTKLGLSCVGAHLGNRNVKINHVLHSGDTVEILTSPQQTPKPDWLNIVVTSRAKMRIRQGMKEIENRESLVGRELLQRRFKNRKIEIGESEMARLILKMGYKSQSQFFHALSTEAITVDQVLATYEEMHTAAEQEQHKAQDFNLEQSRFNQFQNEDGKSEEDVLVIGENLKGVDFKLAGCCHPIYGDNVTGFVSISGGMRIHRSECPNLKRMQERYPYRIVRARWAGKSGSQYNITLRVVGVDDIGIVSNISSIINKERDTLLRSISIDSNDGLFQGQLTVQVSDLSSLKTLIRKLQQVKGVKQVDRAS
ncbi:MAG: HD domain-containing protein [Bacteroidaceae bacterium]|nr:HD domain-containing protein [Bacteroidaceae bacterium]